MTIDDLVELLSEEDYAMACTYLNASGKLLCEPDLTIAPDGEPYLFRWHLLPFTKVGANCYLHIQVKSDPERPLHDHPWDNMSVILAGGYDEIMQRSRWGSNGLPVRSRETLTRRKGAVVQRRANQAHRLILPAEFSYTMTVFSTGPKVREWGFWYPDGWHDNKRHVATREDGASVHV